MTTPDQKTMVHTSDDEITLKELILKIQEFWHELWRNWWIIGLIALPFVLYKAYDAVTTEPIYPAKLTFMVDEDEGNALAGMSSILGQIGLGGIRRGKYNLDKILEISKSRRVLQMALFAKANLKGKDDYLANHLIRSFDLHEEWMDDTTGMQDFLFMRSFTDSFSDPEFMGLKSMQGLLNGSESREGIYRTSYDEDTGIMSLGIESPLEELSIALVDTIFSRLTAYYVEKSTEKSLSTYELMKSKTDSLANALSSAEYNLANFVDRNQNIFSATEGTLKRTRLASNVQRLQIMHGEAIKNLEFADFSLQSKTPFITLIDNAIPPITPIVPSLPKSLIIGALLGTMIGVTFVLGRKIYRDAMNA